MSAFLHALQHARITVDGREFRTTVHAEPGGTITLRAEPQLLAAAAAAAAHSEEYTDFHVCLYAPIEAASSLNKTQGAVATSGAAPHALGDDRSVATGVERSVATNVERSVADVFDPAYGAPCGGAAPRLGAGPSSGTTGGAAEQRAAEVQVTIKLEAPDEDASAAMTSAASRKRKQGDDAEPSSAAAGSAAEADARAANVASLPAAPRAEALPRAVLPLPGARPAEMPAQRAERNPEACITRQHPYTSTPADESKDLRLIAGGLAAHRLQIRIRSDGIEPFSAYLERGSELLQAFRACGMMPNSAKSGQPAMLGPLGPGLGNSQVISLRVTNGKDVLRWLQELYIAFIEPMHEHLHPSFRMALRARASFFEERRREIGEGAEWMYPTWSRAALYTHPCALDMPLAHKPSVLLNCGTHPMAVTFAANLNVKVNKKRRDTVPPGVSRVLLQQGELLFVDSSDLRQVRVQAMDASAADLDYWGVGFHVPPGFMNAEQFGEKVRLRELAEEREREREQSASPSASERSETSDAELDEDASRQGKAVASWLQGRMPATSGSQRNVCDSCAKLLPPGASSAATFIERQHPYDEKDGDKKKSLSLVDGDYVFAQRLVLNPADGQLELALAEGMKLRKPLSHFPFGHTQYSSDVKRLGIYEAGSHSRVFGFGPAENHPDGASEAYLEWLHNLYTKHIEPRHPDLHPHVQEKLRALAAARGLEAVKREYRGFGDKPTAHLHPLWIQAAVFEKFPEEHKQYKVQDRHASPGIVFCGHSYVLCRLTVKEIKASLTRCRELPPAKSLYSSRLVLRAGEVLFYDSELYDCHLTARGSAKSEPCGTVALRTPRQLPRYPPGDGRRFEGLVDDSDEDSDEESNNGVGENARKEVPLVDQAEAGPSCKADNSAGPMEADVHAERNVRRKLDADK